MKFALEELDEQLLASLTRKTLGPGETLFQQGDVGNSMYIVREGRLEALVRQANGSEMKVGEIASAIPLVKFNYLRGAGERPRSAPLMKPCSLNSVGSHSRDFAQIPTILPATQTKNSPTATQESIDAVDAKPDG